MKFAKGVSLFLVLAIMVSVGLTLAQDDDEFMSELNGHWQSISCEHRPPADAPTYLKRDITMTDGVIEIEFNQFFDSFCTQPTFIFHFDGEYELVGDSEVAEGAQESVITITEVGMTPSNEDMAAFFNSAEAGTCGAEEWEVGVEQTVTETGCSLFGLPPNLVTVEYELFHIIDNFLFFAARPLDGTFLDAEEKRPGALLQPLMRVEME